MQEAEVGGRLIFSSVWIVPRLQSVIMKPVSLTIAPKNLTGGSERSSFHLLHCISTRLGLSLRDGQDSCPSEVWLKEGSPRGKISGLLQTAA